MCVDLKSLMICRDSSAHYKQFYQIGKSGKPRLIEQPIGVLDQVHSRIASLLVRVAPPEYMHSGIKKRSHVTNAKCHSETPGRMLTTDLKAFFPSTAKNKIFCFFHVKMKTSSDVADLLSEICTCNHHIPTGSRLSMPLALWANIDMFNELDRVAKSLNIKMTVFVDDITFSGENVNKLFLSTISKIILRNGHIPHPEKTVLYSAHGAKLVTGVVLKNNQLLIKNEQHQKIYQDIEQLKAFKYSQPPHSLKERLLGRLHSLSLIDPRLKDKARSISDINN